MMRGGRRMRLQTVHAIYKDGTLVFANPELAPKDGTEVVVTFLEGVQTEVISTVDPIQALRGRGKGERLVERLLQSRREDRESNERIREHLRS